MVSNSFHEGVYLVQRISGDRASKKKSGSIRDAPPLPRLHAAALDGMVTYRRTVNAESRHRRFALFSPTLSPGDAVECRPPFLF